MAASVAVCIAGTGRNMAGPTSPIRDKSAVANKISCRQNPLHISLACPCDKKTSVLAGGSHLSLL